MLERQVGYRDIYSCHTPLIGIAVPIYSNRSFSAPLALRTGGLRDFRISTFLLVISDESIAIDSLFVSSTSVLVLVGRSEGRGDHKR